MGGGGVNIIKKDMPPKYIAQVHPAILDLNPSGKLSTYLCGKKFCGQTGGKSDFRRIISN